MCRKCWSTAARPPTQKAWANKKKRANVRTSLFSSCTTYRIAGLQLFCLDNSDHFLRLNHAAITGELYGTGNISSTTSITEGPGCIGKLCRCKCTAAVQKCTQQEDASQQFFSHKPVFSKRYLCTTIIVLKTCIRGKTWEWNLKIVHILSYFVVVILDWCLYLS